MTTEPQVFGISKEPAVLFALVLSTAVSSLVSPVIIYLGLPNSDASLTSTFAYAVVALLGALLGLLNVVDSVTRRIPNQVLLAFTVVLVPLVLAQTLVSSEWGKLRISYCSLGWLVCCHVDIHSGKARFLWRGRPQGHSLGHAPSRNLCVLGTSSVGGAVAGLRNLPLNTQMIFHRRESAVRSFYEYCPSYNARNLFPDHDYGYPAHVVAP